MKLGHILSMAAVAALTVAGAAAAQITVLPGENLQAAIDTSGGTTSQRATVNLVAGVYTLDTSLMVTNVDLIGVGPGATILRANSTVTDSVARLMWNCSLRNLTVELSDTFAGAPLVLVDFHEPYFAPIELRNCHVNGKQSLTGVESTGVDIEGGTRDEALVVDCRIEDVATGIFALGSGVNITRCLFDNISGDAVAVYILLLKQSGVDVPLLGDASDIQTTALNQFRTVGGSLLNNMTQTQVLAEMNDWGVYDETQLASRISGPVDSGPFLGKSIAPSSVIVSVLDEQGAPVPASANPTCAISELSLNATRDDKSERFVFNGVTEGTWTVRAFANGYNSASASAAVSGASITPVTLNLTKGLAGGCGSPNSKAVYACSLLFVWGAGRRRRNRHPRASRSRTIF